MLRRLKTTLARTGHDTDVWPVVLLLFAVLAPAVCLLWFMGSAMRNERLAARQKLADVYRAQLSASHARLQRHWTETMAKLEKLAAATPASTAFANCARSGIVDSAVIFDEQERISYPDSPSAPLTPALSPADGEREKGRGAGELEVKWQEASRLDDLRKYLEAAARYDALARETKNEHAAARAFQAEARCLAQAGQNDAVISLVNEVFNSERFRQAADPQGRLIAANAELLALELSTNRNSPAFESIARRLGARLADYENPALAAPQRRFLMHEVQRLSPEKVEFPTLAAEELAAGMIENRANPARGSALQRGAVPDTWQFTTPNHRVLALIRSDRLLAATRAVIISPDAPADVNVTLVSPALDLADAFVTLPAGEQMPGWRLALSLKDRQFFDATAGRQIAVYLWTGMLVVAGMGVLTVIAVRLVRRQMTLARLKNDLAATVSHELKTPLASMRVLVETLLDSEHLDEKKTREYLELIAQENERLGRLIQNFLTYSRMERRKQTFHFSILPAHQVVEAAMESVRGRFEASGCRLEVQIEDDLPPVMADADALAAAVINLLENAYKYSEGIKHIVLRASGNNGSVQFSVTDNGIGITPRERKRIFQPFYQVDQRLSRKGAGCGLGLSIVQFITTAHHGSVSVESQPGRGSTFTISVPAASDATNLKPEAIA
jgi:signal transduction histidine kinase